MSDKQSEALQLADVVDVFDAQSEHMPLELYGDISSELRRLHEVNQELLALARLLLRGLDSGSVKAKPIIEMDDDAPMVQMQSLASIARAAIAKATGENT